MQNNFFRMKSMESKQIYHNQPEYSERYEDDQFEYRYVVLPREMVQDPKYR